MPKPRVVHRRRQQTLQFLPELAVSGLADRLLVYALELERNEPRMRAALLLAAARSAHSVVQTPTGFVRDACAAYDMGRAIGYSERVRRSQEQQRAAAAAIADEAVACGGMRGAAAGDLAQDMTDPDLDSSCGE